MQISILLAVIGFIAALLLEWFKWYLNNQYEPRVVNEQPHSSTPVSIHNGTINMATGSELPVDGQGMIYGHKFAFAFTTLDQGRTLTFSADAMARQLIAIRLYSKSAEQIKHPAIKTSERTYTPHLEWSVEPGSYVVAVVAHSDDGMMTDFDVSYTYNID